MNSERPKHQLVIVGGGIGGLEIATALGRRWRRGGHVAVTLVDEDWAHVWKPMLHTIAAGTRDISQQQTPYLALAHDTGFSFQPGRMEGLDRTARRVTLAPVSTADGRLLIPQRQIRYDTLVMAIGSQANDFGTPGVAEHCLSIDSRSQADHFNREVRVRILQCVAQDIPLSIAIVGGGATGVELAAELVELLDTAGGYEGDNLRSRISITLIESGPRLLAAFPEDISASTCKVLESLGVKVLLGTRVSAATADGFELKDQGHLPASLKVWAAGVKGPDFLSQLDGLEATRSHQLVVQPSLRTTRDPSIFALGDCASLTPAGQQRPLAPTAQVAHQQAQHLVKHLPDAIDGRAVPDFVYHDMGALVQLGDYEAYGSLGQFGLFRGATFRGRLAQFSHVMLYRSHQARLHGFWRGSLMWLVDRLNTRIRAPIRLD